MALSLKGNTSLRVSSIDSITRTGASATADLTLTGDWQAILAGLPTIGQSYPLDAFGSTEFKVANFSCSRSGPTGEIRLHLIAWQTEWELDWTIDEAPLDIHPSFREYFITEPSFAADVTVWRGMRDNPLYAARVAAFEVPVMSGADATVDADWQAMDPHAKTFCAKLAQGIDSYLCPMPVVRRRSLALSLEGFTPTAGAREPPPQNATLATAWLKTVHRAARTADGYVIEEEWTGYNYLDDVLYPPTGGEESE